MRPTIRPHNHNQHEDEDEDDDNYTTITEDIPTFTHTSFQPGKNSEQKASNYRSKHSETEQRRRSKINERFQLLRDLIPPNDQKRDKASLLLEVIEYIQFLQEKLQVYEQSYQQCWLQEPTKLMPWRANHGPLVDNYANHSQGIKINSLDENTTVQSMATIQDSVKPEFSGEYVYRADHSVGPVNPIPLNSPFQPSSYPPQRDIQLVENVASHPHGSTTGEGAIMGIEDRAFERGSSSVSDAYSQGLLKKLTQALQSSGVDISQTDISVQLDVSKQINSASTALASTVMDAVNQSQNDQSVPHSTEASAKQSIQVSKRLRIGES